ncbi:helix-turn-helix domain-containing protein [Nocardia fluminea]|uniref:helix-turn-helix domain-containing protein n=1 Tax=Nocardia fluminea TaxID=134984 RepID=UPI003D0F560B
MDSHAAIVGAQLRAAREAAGVSLAALAAQIHRGKSALAYYETGERTPPPDVIACYEKRFGGLQDPVATLADLGKADVERRAFLRGGYSTHHWAPRYCCPDGWTPPHQYQERRARSGTSDLPMSPMCATS